MNASQKNPKPAAEERPHVVHLETGRHVYGGAQQVLYLTERLPVMVCPRWVETRTQPIAIEDLVAYLVAALDLEPGEGRTVEIGGADVLSFDCGQVHVTANIGAVPVDLPADAEVLLSSDPAAGRTLPPDTTVWWR